MKSKPIVPRTQAHQDVEAAIDHYISENAEKAALGFVDALEAAIKKFLPPKLQESNLKALELGKACCASK